MAHFDKHSKSITALVDVSEAMLNAMEKHGIGKYGSDSYQIFFYNQIPPNVQDKELKKYIDKLVG